jgi:hypothetical protein
MFVSKEKREKIIKEKKEKKQKLEERLKEHKKMDKKKKHTKEVPTMAAKGGRIKAQFGYNSGRTNLLDESRRIRSEPQTRNVRAEEARVRGELNRGYKGGGAAVRGLGRAFTNAKKV